MSQLPEELEALKRFHGHLGPYVVIGYRMGKIARAKYKKRFNCVSKTGPSPPISCIIDGIQLSSGCTLGKGNISIRAENTAAAHFYSDEGVMDIQLLDKVRRVIDAEMNKGNEEELALRYFNMPEAELFSMTFIGQPESQRVLKLK
jgi:formylmethanofuran dehydrogenase subunit E